MPHQCVYVGPGLVRHEGYVFTDGRGYVFSDGRVNYPVKKTEGGREKREKDIRGFSCPFP